MDKVFLQIRSNEFHFIKSIKLTCVFRAFDSHIYFYILNAFLIERENYKV
jgi:hypothetical protein